MFFNNFDLFKVTEKYTIVIQLISKNISPYLKKIHDMHETKLRIFYCSPRANTKYH